VVCDERTTFGARGSPIVSRRIAGGPSLPAWAWPLLALPIVAGVGFWTYWTIATAIKGRLQSALRATLAAEVSAVSQWLAAQANLAELMAADPRVRAEVADLVTVARRTGGDPEALRTAPAQARLRDVMGPVISRQENTDFLVVDATSLVVARMVDERVGTRLALEVADVAAQALAGHRAFLPPTTKQRFAPTPMAFIFVPVREPSGAVVAALAFRIRPEQMAGVLTSATLGGTRETYAVDAGGRMVTDSRFGAELGRLGLLPAEAGGHTTAAFEVRDPGANLVAGRSATTPSGTWPFTWAVAETVAGRSGVNADGYRGYRGIPVVGAWAWMPEWRLGLISEIERDEAYQTLAVLHRSFGVLAGGLLLVATAIALSSRRIYGLEREVERAERLGQYTLEEKIGEGGMGSVYRARHAFLRRPTAIKLVRAERATPSALARFEREVQLTSQLTHPNTIAIYDYGRTPEGVFYYAMEHLPGLPLDRVILDDGPQPEARAVHLLQQICASLGEAHRVGLVHRDIKPGNVMLCERGGTYDVVKVLDFGLVKDLEAEDSEMTAAEQIVGTPHFMAPEAVISAANVTARSDVYAVGAVAYGLVTGQHVFSGKSGGEIIGHHLHSAPVPPSERLGRPVDPFLERLILACLAKDPEERPADAGALLAQFELHWTGPAWTQREAREWWETRGVAMVDARRLAEGSLSREPLLAVDVESRVRAARARGSSDSESLPEIDLESGTQTRLRVRGRAVSGPS
jgi:hypothetical protein